MSTSPIGLTDDEHQRLSEILWRYRKGLHRVEVLLEAQLMFTSAGRDGQLGVVADLMDETAVSLGQLELERELLLHGRPDHRRRDPGPGPDLAELATEADDPWTEILVEHRRSLGEAVARIQQLADQARHGQRATLDMIMQVTDSLTESTVTGYDRSGETVRTPQTAMLFDGRA